MSRITNHRRIAATTRECKGQHTLVKVRAARAKTDATDQLARRDPARPYSLFQVGQGRGGRTGSHNLFLVCTCRAKDRADKHSQECMDKQLSE